MREYTLTRTTNETDIEIKINPDGNGISRITTGIGFFDHMLTAFSRHSGFDLDVKCRGDLSVDCHHTVEDTGIALGSAFAKSIGDKTGIARYGTFTLPMDETLAGCHIDISGRPYLVFNVEFSSDKVGDLDTQMVKEFFYAFAMNARITMHIQVYYGENDHHKTEACFKAFAHALKQAVALSNGSEILSTKGNL